ncbi:hypothetical protein L593_02285 [Salinarchaeum sp. Harcht-Bsk1]|uniref:hypothetical protein n=1 Tax=Salinarchaeum sp. Harcht-Bsk1 TaxID=1333523 RepID=UPI0003423D52|nr:hypothetical protein [Salinarchaeum sp. Harcht-Bsk1]AGN00408.1 hypothetical protein L593_02285 [Salinarchaeum sp. Harcht-Bsk1]
MTRFDASTPDDRRALVADAIRAHRERGSVFCTLEAGSPPPDHATTDDAAIDGDDAVQDADSVVSDAERPAPDVPEADSGDGTLDGEPDAPAWIQFSDPESQLNLDCTDEEYDRITDVLSTAGAFTIDEQASPEEAEGRNLRVTAYADPDRIGQVVDRIFVEGFGYDEDYRLWATEI